MNRTIAFLVAVAAMLPPSVSLATTRNWNDGNGNWSVPGNWSPNGVPAAGDDVNIVTSGFGRTVTLDVDTPSLGLLSIDLSGAGTDTLSDAGGHNLTAAGIYVGGYSGAGPTNGTGAISQSGGTIATTATSFSNLYLGYGEGSSGAYTMSGGTLTVNGYEYDGFAGTGSFTQTGGANVLPNGASLFVSRASGATGTYSLSGTGALSCSGFEFIGYVGTAVFTQTGGSNTTTSELDVGINGGSSSSYNLSGGSVSAFIVTVGSSNPNSVNSAFNISGTSTLTVSNTLNIYSGSSFNFSAGTVNAGGLNFNGNPSLSIGPEARSISPRTSPGIRPPGGPRPAPLSAPP
jgi:hypothetical protein